MGVPRSPGGIAEYQACDVETRVEGEGIHEDNCHFRWRASLIDIMLGERLSDGYVDSSLAQSDLVQKTSH